MLQRTRDADISPISCFIFLGFTPRNGIAGLYSSTFNIMNLNQNSKVLSTSLESPSLRALSLLVSFIVSYELPSQQLLYDLSSLYLFIFTHLSSVCHTKLQAHENRHIVCLVHHCLYRMYHNTWHRMGTK